MESIRATTPVAPYLGGKRKLAARVIQRLSEIRHECYVEPFIGMGGIFLRRPWRADIEVINDISTDVVTLFRILQRHYVAFLDMLKWQLTSRAEFERLRLAAPDTLTDLERAARFLYLQRTAFGGKIAGRTFGVTLSGGARFDITRLAAVLEDVHERLAGVVIERLPYHELIATYDRPATLFYLDPPYWGCETDYGEGVFAPADFQRLAEILAGIKGRFLLSLNDTPEIRAIFAAFTIDAVEVGYSVNGKAQSVAGEVLISNQGAGGSLFG
ncbi:MAG TPA: DNA adenine methylase [Acidocella sp.]|jgi:DNA adenine methylase|uniref:DNA adenine methylase n=1 Tax=Acidocella sp. TaxID=50710 RepID=UPI002B5EF776|nr:DNA adenine methylase [Acidocella sp.]HVE20611.1 DNA adenine methylase [Acidocella sp.]